MERMKADYKTRMTDARHEKLEEEQRKAALDHARIGVARPFGTSREYRIVAEGAA